MIPVRDGVTDLAALNDLLDDATACVYSENPNYYGNLEDVSALAAAAHAKNVKVITGVNPTTLALARTPGECGSDIAVGDGQSLGLDLNFGGPTTGFMRLDKRRLFKE